MDVTTAELQWHLSNINVIRCFKNGEKSGTEEIGLVTLTPVAPFTNMV